MPLLRRAVSGRLAKYPMGTDQDPHLPKMINSPQQLDGLKDGLGMFSL